MKKTFGFMIAVIVIFGVIWGIKLNNNVERPKIFIEDIGNSNFWWNAKKDEEVETPNTWQLDPEIPENYIPVPSQKDLFMEVDNNGYIIAYKKRKKVDDKWVWEKVNPDIPENFEKVLGLEDVYKVTDKDGVVRYYKYIRNKDDTFAFEEVDAKGNIIGMQNPVNEEVPANYEHIGQNKYAVKNQNGVIIGYKQKVKDPDSDGYIWKNIDAPKVDKLQAKNNNNGGFNLSLIGGGDKTGGVKPMGEITGANNFVVPTLAPTKTEKTSTELIYVGEKNNGDTKITYFTPPPGGNMNFPNMPNMPNLPDGSKNMTGMQFHNNEINMQNPNPGYVQTETSVYNEMHGNDKVTYQIQIKRNYDANGNLLSTEKGEPVEVGRQAIQSMQSVTQARSSTLSGELQRVGAGVNFNAPIPNELLSYINTGRMNSNLPPLAMSADSVAYNIALCRVAMYAKTGSPNSEYGSIKDMAGYYGYNSANASENICVAPGGASAEQVNAMITSMAGALEIRNSSSYTNVGIAIAESNGNLYVCEAYID